MPLIDDNTLPDWMLTKDKGGEKILYDPDGKPWITNKIMFSLLMGAVRALDAKIEIIGKGAIS